MHRSIIDRNPDKLFAQKYTERNMLCVSAASCICRLRRAGSKCSKAVFMNHPTIYFTQDNWKAVDFFLLTNMLTRTNRFENLFNDIEPSLISAESSMYTRLAQTLENTDIKSGFRLFCSEGTRDRGFLFRMYGSRLVHGMNPDSVFAQLEDTDPSDLAAELVAYYDNRPQLSPGFYQELCKNKDLLVYYVNALGVSKSIRSELLNFLITPRSVLRNTADMLRNLYGVFCSELASIEPVVNEQISLLKAEIESRGDEFLKDGIRYYPCMLKNRNIKNVYITYLSSIPYSSNIYSEGFDLYVAVGRDFRANRALLEQTDPAVISNKFRPFSDSVRISILKHLQGGSHTLSELSSAMCIPPTTLLHHLNIMEGENVIMRDSEGRRGAYTLKKQGFVSAVSSLRTFMGCCEVD